MTTAFLTPAPQGKHTLWRYVVVSGMTLAAGLAGQIATLPLVQWIGRRNGLDADAVMERLAAGDIAAIGLPHTLAFALAMLSFAAALATLFIGVRWLHRRPALSILTTRRSFDLGRVAVAAGLWVTLAGGSVLLAIPKDQLTFQFDPAAFVPLAIVALLFTPIQVLAEDALFRGYWMQGLARLTRHPMAALLISSLIFMSMHLANPELENGAARVLPFYFTLGLLFGILTILDDGLELGTGCHLGNNLFVVLILSSSDGAVDTPSVFTTQTGAIVDTMWVLAIVIPVVFALLQLCYRFNWSRLRRL